MADRDPWDQGEVDPWEVKDPWEQGNDKKTKKNIVKDMLGDDFSKKAGQGAQVGADVFAGMMAGLPAQIQGGLAGIGTLMAGQGFDRAADVAKGQQQWNFGAGEYRGVTPQGQQKIEQFGEALETPVEKAMQLGEKLGGNEGAYIAELLSRSAINLLDPAIVAKGLGGMRRGKGEVPKAEGGELKAGKEAVADIQLDPWEQKAEGSGRRLDIDLSEGPGLGEVFVDKNGVAYPQRELGGDFPGIDRAEYQRDLLESRRKANEAMAAANELRQMDLYDLDNQGKAANQFEAQEGLWRVDENGMPVRVDISMEGQGLQQPLQRGLWGDELGAREHPVGQSAPMPMDRSLPGMELAPDTAPDAIRGITQAMDETRRRAMETSEDHANTRELLSQMQEQMNRLSHDIKADPKFERALLDAELRAAAPRSEDPSLSPSVPKGQRGSADLPTIATLATVGGLAAAGLSKDDEGKKIGLGIAAVGALGALPKSNPLRKLTKGADNTYISPDPTKTELAASIAKARGEKDGKGLTFFGSGAQLEAMKRGSEAIRVVADSIQNAFKRADLAIRNSVFPAEKAIRKLDTDMLEATGELFKKEMFAGQRISPQQLATLPVKMQNAYRVMREMFDDALKVQNEARAAKGQEPITPIEAYLSSRWGGDFRRPIYDTNGKLVWYLASNSKAGLNAQTRALLRDHPDLVYDPKKDHTVRFWNRKTDLESAYTTMVDILGRDDPAVAVLQKYMEDQTTARGATFLNQEKHFKQKGNVRGFVGDRPEVRLGDLTDKNIPFADAFTVAHGKKSEMVAMFEQQIQYAKNAHRWAELQKAGQIVKEVLNDPELVDKQPNNVKYIREYFKHSIGYGESAWSRLTADKMKDLGVSPKPFDDTISGVKSYFILNKLAANLGYFTAGGFQLMMTLPHMTDLFFKGYRANPAKAYAAGILGGMFMGTGHIANSLGGKMHDLPGFDFFNSAAKYAEDNGITARSIYDEAPIGKSFSKVGQAGMVAGKTMTYPETIMRSMAFMSMAQYLKDTGKFKSELDIFREAERRTNIAMVDYASTERPMVFAKLGSAGNMLNTLQTFSFNYFNQLSYFWRQAAKGNFMPLAAFMGVQYMMAGAMGIPGVDDAYKAWMTMRDWIPPNQWRKIMDDPFLSDPKLWMLENAGNSTTYGYLSDKTGLGMTSRLASPSGGNMLASPAGPIMDIGKQIGSVASLAMDPTNQTKQAQAAMNVAPTGLQGLLETAPFMEGQTFVTRQNPETGETERVYKRPTKLAERKGLITRTPKEEQVRKYGMGLREQSEVLNRDIQYSTKRNSDAAAEKTRDIPSAFYDAIRRGDEETAKEYHKTYTYLTGKKITNEMIQQRIADEFMTDTEKQKKTAKRSISALKNVKRMSELFEKIEQENRNYAPKQPWQDSTD